MQSFFYLNRVIFLSECCTLPGVCRLYRRKVMTHLAAFTFHWTVQLFVVIEFEFLLPAWYDISIFHAIPKKTINLISKSSFTTLC